MARHKDRVATLPKPLSEVIDAQLSSSEDEDIGRYEVALLLLARHLEELRALKGEKYLLAQHRLTTNSIGVKLKAIRRGGAPGSIAGEVATATRLERDLSRRRQLSRLSWRVHAALLPEGPPRRVELRDLLVRHLKQAAELFQIEHVSAEDMGDHVVASSRAFIASIAQVSPDLGARLSAHPEKVGVVLATWRPSPSEGRAPAGRKTYAMQRDELLNDLLGAIGLAISKSALKSARQRAKKKATAAKP